MTRPARIARALAAHPRWLVLLAAGGAAALLATWVAAPATPSASAGDRWGVDQLRIRRTAEGHLLDLRYRVVDAQRAGSLLAKTSRVYLVHERSGRRLPVPITPKAGALRSTGQPRVGHSYFALFSNPGGLVRSGDQVSVVLGQAEGRSAVAGQAVAGPAVAGPTVARLTVE